MHNNTRIRALTIGGAIQDFTPSTWVKLTAFFTQAQLAFLQQGLALQTCRLTLEPLKPGMGFSKARLYSALDSLMRGSAHANVRWLCLPVSCADGWEEVDLRTTCTDILQKYPQVFFHFMAAQSSVIHFGSLLAVAKEILSVSRLSQSGFDNFRVGAGANIAPNTPFFPFSWHDGNMGFSIAIEIVALLREHIIEQQSQYKDIDKLFASCVELLQNTCLQVGDIARSLSKKFSLQYKGIDISLAPYPDSEHSVANLVTLLGVERFGETGTLAATAFFSRMIKVAIQNSEEPAAGFNGVMYSPLEDTGLANAMKIGGYLSPENFMLYSSVCGCGLDMIPVPGEIFAENLASTIQDICVLSSVLQKPLGVRVLPIPHKRANELTAFNHDFLYNTRIINLEGQGILSHSDSKLFSIYNQQ